MSGIKISCGRCGQEADIDEWSRTPISGALPLNEYQCPNCKLAFAKKHEPTEFYGDEYAELAVPGETKLVQVGARL